jgi:hypothetical protein
MLITGLLTLQTLFVGAGSIGGIIHVPADVPTIQSAINTAGHFDVIVVAPGTYHETINFLGKAITLRSSGGAALTTIDATGLGGSVVTCASGEGAGTVLNGFTITGGTGTQPPEFNDLLGGGMYNGGSNPTVTNCTFSGNTAPFGSGMFNYNSSPAVTNCTFSGNASLDISGGGGMYNYESTPTVTNCMFGTNMAEDGGGMLNDYSNPTVTGCTFSANRALFTGGGMGNYNNSSPTVTNCMFSGNRGGSGWGGGGMYSEDSSPTVINCTFSGNTVTNQSIK